MSGHDCPECGESFPSSSCAIGGSVGHDCQPARCLHGLPVEAPCAPCYKLFAGISSERDELSALCLSFLKPPTHSGGSWTLNPDALADAIIEAGWQR